MLEVVSPQPAPITLDSLYAHAKVMGMRVVIDDHYWPSKIIRVELRCTNRGDSTFTFVGTSTNSLHEAFLNAFKEAEVIGRGYV